MTFHDWETATLTADERSFETATHLAVGIGTNPPKMLEYGYDLCDLYQQHPESTRGSIIHDWATAEHLPVASASTLGAAATDYLCP